MNFFTFFLLFPLFSISFSHEPNNPRILLRHMLLEDPQRTLTSSLRSKKHHGKEHFFECTSWRFSVESNSINSWETVPLKCGYYVKKYMTGPAYHYDLKRVAYNAEVYAKSLELGGKGKEVWVFDLDDTLISTLPYYADHGYGTEVYNDTSFDIWLEKGEAPAVKSLVKFYYKLKALGIKVFLMTGRSESYRAITVKSLKDSGIKNWDKLILRGSDEVGEKAMVYKSEHRREFEKEGYIIVGNMGDQWSDLLGFPMANKSFKVPNPMYYIS